MANPKIKVKRSSVEGKVPAVSQLERGELAVNSYDGKVYILKDQFSVGIATTTHTINPWNEPGGVGAGVSYSGGINVLGISTFSSKLDVDGHTRLNSFLNVSGISTFQNDITIKENSPNLKFHDINADADNQRWDLKCGSSNTFMIQAINDAGGGGGNLFEFTRNGNAIQTFVGKRSGITWFTVDNLNKKVTTEKLTVGNYDFPTVAGSEGLVLKVASDGNLEFGSGASGGVVPTEKTFTATQGQTVFTDTTNLPTYVQVFVNGIKIRPTSDFSQSGASITLVTAATAGDEIDLVRFD
jgi:hypothetical protein